MTKERNKDIERDINIDDDIFEFDLDEEMEERMSNMWKDMVFFETIKRNAEKEDNASSKGDTDA